MTRLILSVVISAVLAICSIAAGQPGGPVRLPQAELEPAEPAGPEPGIIMDRPRAAQPPAPADAAGAIVSAVTESPLVFVATVAEVVQGPMALSEPPILSMTITFKDSEMIKGDKPGELVFSYRVTRGRGIEPVAGQKLLVAAERPAERPQIEGRPQGGGPRIGRLPIGGGGGPAIRLLAEATDDNLALARTAAKLPAGWTVDKAAKPVSPWAALGEKAWPKGIKHKFEAEIVCATTGRPALRAGAGVKLTVEQIIPAQVEKFRNPFGDGKFRVTVTNTTDKPLDVPALLTNDGKEILWADSLLLIERSRPHLLPEAGRLTADARPVRLAAGESVSAEIDTLKLSQVSWPRGGSRVYFRFALGELVQENFFYYYSDRHDKMRAAGPAATPAPAPTPAPAGEQAGWTRLFADEQWYKAQTTDEQQFVGTLQAVPNADLPSTLMRTSYYRLGRRTMYTAAKKVPALDGLVGKRVVIRGKPYDIELSGQAVSEIWPAAVRLAGPEDKDMDLPLPAKADEAGACLAPITQ